jgi:hypothetical protein
MNTKEMILLLSNKLNSLNAAIGSAMQTGNVEVVQSLSKECLQIESEIAALKAQE